MNKVHNDANFICIKGNVDTSMKGIELKMKEGHVTICLPYEDEFLNDWCKGVMHHHMLIAMGTSQKVDITLDQMYWMGELELGLKGIEKLHYRQTKYGVHT